MKLTGAQALIKSLEMEGVEVMFGLPGGALLQLMRHRLGRRWQPPVRDCPAPQTDGIDGLGGALSVLAV